MNALIKFGQEQWTGDEQQDLKKLADLVQREFNNVYKYLTALPNVSGTFTSQDGKTITVQNGIVQTIK